MQHTIPSLAKSIKMAGLVLVIDRSDGEQNGQLVRQIHRIPEGVDGILKSNGVLKFNEMVDV